MRRLIYPALILVGFLVGGVVFLKADRKAPDVPTMVIHRRDIRTKVSAEGQLEAVKSTPLSAPIVAGMRQKIAWMLPDGSWVDNGDVVIRFDRSDFEQMREEGRDEESIIEKRLGKAEIQADIKLRNLERDSRLSEEEAKIARDFKSADTEIYARNAIIESDIDTGLAEEKAEHARQAGKIQKDLSRAERELLEIEARKKKLMIEKAETGLKSLEILAPHEGYVIYKRDWRGNIPRVGDVAWPGQPLASIPKLDSMQAEVFVLEADAGGLAPKKKAGLRIDAHPEQLLSAEVISVDPIAQRRIRWVPVQYFRVVLGLQESNPKLMKPGQRVHAVITIAEEAAAIAIPRQAVIPQDGKKIVYRLEAGEFKAVEVDVGASALGKIIITRGLEEGDVIALRDPNEGLEGSKSSTGPQAFGGVS